MTSNLQALVWVPDERTLDTDESVAIAYAIDGVYVYRRLTRLAVDVPRAQYFRAHHRDVLHGEGNWSDIDKSIWEPVDEIGGPIAGKT